MNERKQDLTGLLAGLARALGTFDRKKRKDEKRLFIVLDNHRVDKPPIGKIVFHKDFDINKINWSKYHLEPGWVGDKHKSKELIELSLVKDLKAIEEVS